MDFKPLIGEFFGTLILVLLGNGIVANIVLKKTKGEGSGWPVITLGWTLGVMMGVFAAIGTGSMGAHINPAVTIALAVAGKTPWADFVPFFAAQTLGGLAGAVLVYLHFLPHWAETPDKGAKLACFSTGPSIRNLGWATLCEAIGTFVLVVGIACIVATKPAPGLVPFLVGGLVGAIGAGLGGTTGFAINPARDLGPRIAHAILPIAGKGDSDWGYAAVPVLGGLAGGVLGGLFIAALQII